MKKTHYMALILSGLFIANFLSLILAQEEGTPKESQEIVGAVAKTPFGKTASLKAPPPFPIPVKDKQCNKCHEASVLAWKSSLPHFNSWSKVTGGDGRTIKKRLGDKVDEISRCAQCHATVQHQFQGEGKPGQDTIISGVSCESCHNPGFNWVEPHQKKSKKEEAVKAGLVRPQHHLYQLIKGCYECHMVGDEELVNKGKHPTGFQFEIKEGNFQVTKNFEFVARFHGHVRHNLLTYDVEKKGTNRKTKEERKSLMYVLGKMVAFEMALHHYSKAKNKKGDYANNLGLRALASYRDLKEIRKAAPLEELKKIRDIVANLKLKDAPKAKIEEAAKKVGQQAQNFFQKYKNDKEMAQLHKKVKDLLPREKEYFGSPYKVK